MIRLGITLAPVAFCLSISLIFLIYPAQYLLASREDVPEGLTIIYLTVSIAEENAPKRNVLCTVYECQLYDEQFDIGATIENKFNETKSYVVVIEVRKNNTTLLLTSESVQTPPHQSETIYITWTPDEGADYQVRAFLLSDLEIPQILSPVKTSEVTIIDNSFKGLIRMEKHACLGGCPVYHVDVYQNRTAVFEGYVNIAEPGRYVFEISDEQYEQLIDEFQKADFLSMNYSRILVTDAADIEITFNMNGNKNTIYYYPFRAPEELLELERQIDEILGTSRWVQGE